MAPSHDSMLPPPYLGLFSIQVHSTLKQLVSPARDFLVPDTHVNDMQRYMLPLNGTLVIIQDHWTLFAEMLMILVGKYHVEVKKSPHLLLCQCSLTNSSSISAMTQRGEYPDLFSVFASNVFSWSERTKIRWRDTTIWYSPRISTLTPISFACTPLLVLN